MDPEKNSPKIKTENLEMCSSVIGRFPNSRGIKIEEGYAKICNEQITTIREKNSKISELDMKLREMKKDAEESKRQKSAANQKIEALSRQISELKEREEKLMATIGEKQLETDKIVAALKHASKTVEHLGRELLACEVHKKECNKEIEELKMKLSESESMVNELNQAVDDLKKQNLEVVNYARLMKKKFDDLAPLAVGLGDCLKIKIDDLVNQSETIAWAGDTSAVKDVIEIVSDSEEEMKGGGDDCVENNLDDEETKDSSEVSLSVTNNKKRSNFDDERNKIVTTRRKPWTCDSDMLDAFEEDDELCLNAICALYRQQIGSPDVSLFHFNMMGGRDLAEFLIDGDQELKLRKSVSEVNQESPDALDRCRNIAMSYCGHLFILYCSGDDPFFGPM